MPYLFWMAKYVESETLPTAGSTFQIRKGNVTPQSKQMLCLHVILQIFKRLHWGPGLTSTTDHGS